MEHHEAQQQKSIVPSQQGSLREAPPSLLPGVLGRLKQREHSSATQRSNQELLEALAHPQWEIRSAAVRALGNLGEEAPLQSLLEALQDEHRLVRAAAVYALGRLKEQIPMEHLLLALRDEEWEVREMAVLVLGELNNTIIEPLLHVALHDSNASVRETAHYISSLRGEARVQITGKERQRFRAPTIAIPVGTYLNEGILHLWLVFRRQAALLNRSTWLIPPLAMVIACILIFFLHADAGWSLTVAALSASATSTAHIYGSENDAGMELTLSTPTSIRTILFSRLTLVLSYNVLLAALTSVILVLEHGGGFWMLVRLWLGPALFLSSLSLALSLLVGSMFASLVALLLEASQMIQFSLEKPFFLIQTANINTTLWQLHPVILCGVALCCIAFAVIYAPRQPSLAHY
ncbi:MAG: HEAT repeat domain-containing protein [Ktedonobacteraceae bacterium]|nr:HEAT repeat domain-containing protein [Ktedonobacteraceae bacterium]MBV9712279.1 HEAT repeat domain-containing protein [Ktedonobacteraceae bacterium]